MNGLMIHFNPSQIARQVQPIGTRIKPRRQVRDCVDVVVEHRMEKEFVDQGHTEGDHRRREIISVGGKTFPRSAAGAQRTDHRRRSGRCVS